MKYQVIISECFYAQSELCLLADASKLDAYKVMSVVPLHTVSSVNGTWHGITYLVSLRCMYYNVHRHNKLWCLHGHSRDNT